MSIPFLSDIILKKGNKIQFTTEAGANAATIDIDGSGNLVFDNTVGDILLGDGSSDVFIGDGTNTVDIRFEQNMAIFADSSSTRTLTLGGSNTNLVLESPTISGTMTLGATTINNKLTFTTANGYILFDYEPSGDTGEYSTETPLIKVDMNGSESVILSRMSEYRAVALGIDDTVWLRAGDTGSVIKANVNLTAEQVLMSAEQGFHAYAFPNNDTTWSNRNEFRFYGGSATASDNGLYIGDGGNTQFIDLSRNLKNIGTINSGAITSTGTITATQLDLENMGNYITFYGGGETNHSITSRQLDGGTGDDIRLNTYGSFIVNLDSNNNQAAAANSSFFIGRHGGNASAIGASDQIFTVDGQNGHVTATGNITTTGTVTTTSTSAGAITLNGGTGVSTTGAFVLRQNGDGDGNGIAITSSNATSHRIWKDASGNFYIGSSANSNAFKQDTTGNVTIEGTITSGNLIPSEDGTKNIGNSSSRWSALELKSGGQIQWQNGDARIIEGLVNNYSLSLQTYDGSALSTALRLDGNNDATFNGDIIIDNHNGSNPTDAGSLYFNEAGTTWASDMYGFRINQEGSSNLLQFQSVYGDSNVNTILTLNRDTKEAIFSGHVKLSTNSHVMSARKFTARDGNGVMLTADDASSGLTIADNGNATFSGTVSASNLSGTNTGDQVLPTDFVSKASGGTFTGALEIGLSTNTSGSSTGTTFLELDNNVGGDISQQQTFIDFKFTDTNANYTPQVRIGAQVGPDADANAISKEGAGSFVVYTAPIGSDESGNSSGLAESMRVSHDGDVTIAGSVTANGTVLTGAPDLSSYAPLASPALTGNPTAPTQSAGNNTTRIATTAFVSTAVANLVASAPADLDTLNELAAALNNDDEFSTTVTTSLGNRVRIDTANQGLDATQKSNARTNIGAQVAGSYLTSFDITTQTDSKYLRSDTADTASGVISFTSGIKTPSITTVNTDQSLFLYANGSGHIYFGDSGNGTNLYHYSTDNDGVYTTIDWSGNYYRLRTTATNGIWVDDPLRVSNNITVGGTVDGVDIATRDGVLTSTTTTANAALPKAGGTMTGNLVMEDEMVDFANNGDPELPNFKGKRSNTRLNDRDWDTEGGWSYTTFENSTTDRPSDGLHNGNGLLTFNTHGGDGTNNYMHQIAMTTNTNKLWHRRRSGASWGSWEEILKGSQTFASLTSKPTTISGYGITDAYTKTESDGKYLLNTTDTLSGNLTVTGNLTVQGVNYGLYHAENAASNESGSSSNYYHDPYGGGRHLSMFLKNARADIIRYRAIDNFEYWNGSSWVTDNDQLANVKKLLDGRQDTNWYFGSTYYKFRFTIAPSTPWPTTAKVGTQTSWTGSTYPGHRMIVEEYDGSSWSTRVTAKFGGSGTTVETTDNNCDNWGWNFLSTNQLHTGNGNNTGYQSGQNTRITIDFYGWSPSNSSYVTVPMQNIFITSNFSGIENTDYTNLLDYDRNITTAGAINLGHSSDTTIARSAAGKVTIEGNEIYHEGHKPTLAELGAQASGNYITGSGSLSAQDLTDIGNLSGTNTGDQDITGIATNATAISNITSFPGFGTTSGTALEGNTTIPSGNQIIDWTAENAGTIHSSNVPAETYTAHEDISAASSNLDNSGRTYIQDITLDSNGHVTGVATATETVVNTNTQLSNSEVIDAIVESTAISNSNKTTIRSNIGAGTVTSVATGNGLTGGTFSSSGTVSIDYTAGGNSLIGSLNAGSPSSNAQIVYAETGGHGKISFSNLGLSLFDNDAGFLTSSSTQSKYIRSDASDTVNGNTTWEDSHYIALGDGQDLRIYHDGTNNIIKNTKHGANTYLQSENSSGTNQNCIVFGGASGAVELRYNNANRFLTTTSGSELNGVITLNNKLELSYTSTSGSQFEQPSTSVTTYRVNSDRWRVWMGNGSSETFTVTEGGRIGINDSSPDYTLDVYGNVSNISIYASHDIAAYSDARVKDEIETIPNALDKVNKLRGVTFVRTDEGSTDKRMMGVIAQEVKDILPEVVNERESDGHYSVSYGNMVGVLIEAVKELTAEVEELKKCGKCDNCNCKNK